MEYAYIDASTGFPSFTEMYRDYDPIKYRRLKAELEKKIVQRSLLTGKFQPQTERFHLEKHYRREHVTLETLANIHMNKQNNKRERCNSTGGDRSVAKINSTLAMFPMRQHENVKRTGSFVIGQKLRESKWFTHAEMNIFCAVVESGFIIEQKKEEVSTHGVAIWAPSYEKSKNPEYLTIYTITETKGKFKVLPLKLIEFWPDGTTVKINNKSDKTETPLAEDVVRNQIMAAENSKRKWHNTEHFAYYCRYGPVATNVRMRKITDGLRWNTGTFFLKIRSLTAK